MLISHVSGVRVYVPPAHQLLGYVTVLLLLAGPAFAQPPNQAGWPELPPPAGAAAGNRPATVTPPRVVDVRIVGNETVNADRVVAQIKTRVGRAFDPEALQRDKGKLISAGMFREVKVYTQNVAEGVVVTFEVFERPTIREVVFIGDRGISERKLLRESGLEVGDGLNLFAIQEARRKLEEFYRRQGFPKATVSIDKGDAPEDRSVVFVINEGPLQRIEKVEFIGNTIASDQRLKTLIDSKPGILWYFLRGKVDPTKIDSDVRKLTDYYRSLGFFGARIGREMEFDEGNRWLTLKFIIDEGPRYVVDDVAIVGNTRFKTAALLEALNLTEGDYFNLGAMNKDVGQLRDLYHSQGHIFANIEASPRFLIDEPGKLSLVYQVEQGERFRVGRINVHIAGEFPHTRESVVRNRLSVRTGDIADMREVEASERRLRASQLFEDSPANGKRPRIVIRPPELNDADSLINHGRRGGTMRGQSPDKESR